MINQNSDTRVGLIAGATALVADERASWPRDRRHLQGSGQHWASHFPQLGHIPPAGGPNVACATSHTLLSGASGLRSVPLGYRRKVINPYPTCPYILIDKHDRVIEADGRAWPFSHYSKKLRSRIGKGFTAYDRLMLEICEHPAWWYYASGAWPLRVLGKQSFSSLHQRQLMTLLRDAAYVGNALAKGRCPAVVETRGGESNCGAYGIRAAPEVPVFFRSAPIV